MGLKRRCWEGGAARFRGVPSTSEEARGGQVEAIALTPAEDGGGTGGGGCDGGGTGDFFN